MATPSPIPITDANPEVWRPVVDFEGWYEVSSHGGIRRIRTLHRLTWRFRAKPRAMRTRAGIGGYHLLTLCRDGVKHGVKVHRVVARAFLGETPDGCEIAHLDGNVANNRAINLAHVTHRENYQHSVFHGTRAIGDRHGRSKAGRKRKTPAKRRWRPPEMRLD